MNPSPPAADVWVVVGTRPDVIKQAPVYLACRERLGADRVALVGTGQHRELLAQALSHFELELDFNLDVMEPDQPLTDVSAAIVGGFGTILRRAAPRYLVVQGDTSTAAMAAWAAFQEGVPVAHNEAGLRSFDLTSPFPEEANRRLISMVASLHFAPTERARDNLLAEHVAPDSIHVTGNPGVDALLFTLARPSGEEVAGLASAIADRGSKLVLLTAHRRENMGDPMDRWFAALADFVQSRPDLELVYPIHLNNAGRAEAARHLMCDRVHLVQPLGYAATCQLLARCHFVITDSGGIQEEAAALDLSTVVCRTTTERPEAIDAGCAVLAGTTPEPLREALDWAYLRGSGNGGPIRPVFGDGRSGARIAELLEERLP